MLVLTDIQKVGFTVSAVSAAGNPASLDGAPVWTCTDDSLLSLVVSEDGLSCEAVTTGKLGVAQVKVEADADLGEGVTSLFGVIDVQIVASQAVNLEVKPGVPTDK